MSKVADLRPMPVSWRDTLASLPHFPVFLLSVFAHMTIFGMLTPVMAIYAKGFGALEWQIGLMITIFAAGRLIADIPAGHFSRRTGLRPLFAIGLLLCSAGAIIAATAALYWVVLLGRGLQGVGSGFFMTAAMIYCAQNSHPGNRGKIMSMFQGAVLTGGALGPSIGGLAAAAFGLHGPFYVSAIVALVAGLLPLVLFQETPSSGPQTSKKVAAPNLIFVLPFFVALLANFGFFMTRTAGQWQMIPLLADERFQIGPDRIGFALSLTAIATLCALPVAAYLVDHVPRGRIIMISLLATGASLAAIVIAKTDLTFYFAMAAMGVSTGIGGPALAAYAVDLVPIDQQGSAIGTLRFAGDLGYLIGPLSIGAVVDLANIGQGGGLTVNAGFLVLCAVIFAVALRRNTP